jgi:hypothetical protein
MIGLSGFTLLPVDTVNAVQTLKIETLKPYTDAAAKVDADRLALSERENELASGEAQLGEVRNGIETERRELRRARADHSDALVLAKAVGTGADGDAALQELHRLTRDLKQSLRAAEDKVIRQDRQLVANAREQEDTHAKIAKLGEVNLGMREELRRTSKDAERRIQKGERLMACSWVGGRKCPPPPPPPLLLRGGVAVVRCCKPTLFGLLVVFIDG